MLIKISECESVEHPFFAKEARAYWCLHCERVSKASEWRDKDFDCPYDGCDGGAFDMHPFERDFEVGKVYSMYEGE